MIKVGTGWQSEFPNDQGVRKSIVRDGGQVTVASFKSLTGGHSMMYLEFIDIMGFAVTRKIHLLAGPNGIEIEDQETEVNQESDCRANDYYYKSYTLTDAQRAGVEAAALRFKAKNANGRYTYRLAGGTIGRLTTRPKTRGVNCADFVIKVLDEAGVTRIKSKIFNTPARIAGH